MNYLNQILPKDLQEAFADHITKDDIAMVARMTAISETTIKDLIKGNHSLTAYTAPAFDKLVSFAKANSLAAIELIDKQRELLSNISDHTL